MEPCPRCGRADVHVLKEPSRKLAEAGEKKYNFLENPVTDPQTYSIVSKRWEDVEQLLDDAEKIIGERYHSVIGDTVCFECRGINTDHKEKCPRIEWLARYEQLEVA